MALRCTECGALTIPEGPELDLSVTTDLGTLARHLTLMNTNDPPQDSERLYVREVVSKADARLACVEDEISRLEDRLKVLLREHALLSEYRTKNVGILSPLRRMPPEILGQIFSWALPTDEQAKSPAYRPNPKDSPWVLTWISSRWRAIAVSTHSLWSLVHVDAAGSLHSLSMIQTQVQRARGLKIHFYGRQERNAAPQIQLFRFLSEHSNRWEALCLRLTSALVPRLDSLRGQLPALRRLWLEWDTPESQNRIDWIECFGVAPCLVDVGVHSGNHFIPVSLPARPNHITRYDLDADWPTHRRLLAQLPNLVEARLQASLGAPWPDHTNHKTSLPHLRRLYASQTQVLNYLKAPALEEMAVHVHDVPPGYCKQSISAFIRRSSCSLRRLCLEGPPLDPESLTFVLSNNSSVVELINITADAKDLFVILTHAENPFFPVAPHLSAIHFDLTSGSIDYDLYLNILESRCRAPHYSLKSATLLVPLDQGPSPAVLSKLDSLRSRRGLEVKVLSGVKARIERDTWLYKACWTST
ncbi:hypothetical protein FB45DRAFT_811734 [Roridomyces roridus]|uniref:F-box domain-containing protein n=1 Tax=Roridomyces roridus TaxID=1738132 RepID=A0AAD7AY48_9AGAR|nr:hypothetical protein FB45DRAFT_811734 [Roridomyces roridus]